MARAERLARLLAATLLAACATAPQTGVIAGRWTPHARSTTPITLAWESQGDTHGEMSTTLGPGGERFQGQYVRVTAETKYGEVAPIVGAWGSVWEDFDWGAPLDPWWWGGVDVPADYDETYYAGFVKSYTGKVVATLFGNRGHSMRCRFTLNDPAAGLVGGGVGGCQTSDGGEIDAEF